MAANLENPAVATELEKSVFIPVPKKESNALGRKPWGLLYPILRYHPGQRCTCMVTESTILLQALPKLCKSVFVSRQWCRMVYISVLEGVQDTSQDELADILKSISPTLPASRPFLPSTVSPDSSMAQSFSSSGLCSNVTSLKCHSVNHMAHFPHRTEHDL